MTPEPAEGIFASEAEVATALAVCAEEMDRGAAPLAFSEEARAATRERYARGFRQNLPKVGGFPPIESTMRRVAFFLGTLAREIATFHRASGISENHAAVARSVVENECDLAAQGTPKGREGLICNGLG
jgi:hypothetical protein